MIRCFLLVQLVMKTYQYMSLVSTGVGGIHFTDVIVVDWISNQGIVGVPTYSLSCKGIYLKSYSSTLYVFEDNLPY